MEVVLHSFTNGSDGFEPVANLLRNVGSSGTTTLYGVTLEGGVGNGGTIFQMTPPTIVGGAWSEKVLYAFGGVGDGVEPEAGLIADKTGALYGTTFLGGANGLGTVFKLIPPATVGGAWAEMVLYSFAAGGGDGHYPVGNLVAVASPFGPTASLYGTTYQGGAGNTGTVFKLTPPPSAGGAWTEAVLYNFASGSDGHSPLGGLVIDKTGALYGTTYQGGTHLAGTVFKLTPPSSTSGVWTETVLHNFCSETNCIDGDAPYAGIISDKAGALYGTTYLGGAFGAGTVFKITQ